MAETEFKLNPDGHDDPEEETQEQLDSALKNLKDLGGTSLASLSKQDLSLMKQMLATTSEEYRELIFFRALDFIDTDEALDHVAAYFEAKELGMDTSFNVAFMFAMVSVNDKNNKTNLMAQLLGALHPFKTAGSQTKWRGNGHNPRSPID